MMSAQSSHSPAVEKVVPMPRVGDETLFEHAPPMGVQRRLGLVKPSSLNIRQRALLVVLVGWAPLILLAIVQSAWARADVVTPLLWEAGVHARYLVAVSLLVVAEAACAPQLNAIIRQFIDSGIVQEHDRSRFDEAVVSTRHLLQSPTVELVVIALAYLVTLSAALSHSLEQLPDWAKPVGGMPRYSLAGWWHTLVSLPLLLVLIFGWLWRLALWARLLWRISRLDLRLVASHPDHCSGLAFVGHSVRAFAIVALALAVIVAGRSAHLVLIGGDLPTQYFSFNIGLLVTVMALFVAPLLAFTTPLMRAWRRGTLAYGALAEQVGTAFEQKWLGTSKADQSALTQPDFSATTDLYSIVANVHAIRFVPVDLRDLIVLAGAMLLPFVPVALLAFPLDVIWAQTKSLLF
jgi:hypothetical protein